MISDFLNKKWHGFLFLFVHIGIFFTLYFFNQIKIGINDDLALLGLLQNGFAGTLILSYPTSFLLSFLYVNFENTQWLSIFYITTLVVSVLPFYLYIYQQEKNIVSKLLILLVSLSVFAYSLSNISITLLTLILFSASLLSYKNNKYLSFIYLSFAMFLRVDIAILCLPFLVIAFLIIEKPTYKNIAYFFIAILVPFLLNSYLVTNDKQYSEWLNFNKSRAFFQDLRGDLDKTNFSELEKNLIRGWWVPDESVLKSEKVIENTYSSSELYLEQIEKADFKKIIRHNYRTVFILLMLFSIFIFYRKDALSKLGIITFVFGFLFLIILRDVDRVIGPLLVLFFLLVYLNIQNSKIRLLFLLLIAPLLAVKLPIPKKPMPTEILVKKDSIVNFLENTNHKCEIAIYFPYERGDSELLLSWNLIFDEKKWQMNRGGVLLPAGWLARHPFFYQSHNISYGNIKLKYDTYYDWLMSEGCFVGDSSIKNEEHVKKVLLLYDEIYDEVSCSHTIEIFDKKENISVSRIILNCKDKQK